MIFYSGDWERKRVDVYNEKGFCAADDLTLKNEFEPEPKHGQGLSALRGSEKRERSSEDSRGVENKGVCSFTDLSEKKPL